MDLTPQQVEFLRNYTDINSDTFSNAKQSALKAKYSEEYSDNIMSLMPDWLSENIGDNKRLRKAEQNLDKALEIDIADEKNGDKALKATIFVAERLGKRKYAQRAEHTGANGEKLVVSFDQTFNAHNSPSKTEGSGSV